MHKTNRKDSNKKYYDISKDAIKYFKDLFNNKYNKEIVNKLNYIDKNINGDNYELLFMETFHYFFKKLTAPLAMLNAFYIMKNNKEILPINIQIAKAVRSISNFYPNDFINLTYYYDKEYEIGYCFIVLRIAGSQITSMPFIASKNTMLLQQYTSNVNEILKDDEFIENCKFSSTDELYEKFSYLLEIEYIDLKDCFDYKYYNFFKKDYFDDYFKNRFNFINNNESDENVNDDENEFDNLVSDPNEPHLPRFTLQKENFILKYKKLIEIFEAINSSKNIFEYKQKIDELIELRFLDKELTISDICLFYWRIYEKELLPFDLLIDLRFKELVAICSYEDVLLFRVIENKLFDGSMIELVYFVNGIYENEDDSLFGDKPKYKVFNFVSFGNGELAVYITKKLEIIILKEKGLVVKNLNDLSVINKMSDNFIESIFKQAIKKINPKDYFVSKFYDVSSSTFKEAINNLKEDKN